MMSGATAPRPAGQIVISGPDGVTEFDTLQCVHCGCHWIIKPGSGRLRGFCMNCAGPICGLQGCMQRCYPFEKQLDDAESGRVR